MINLRRIGAVDGSVDAGTRRFHVVLDDDATVQLDDLVVCRQLLPNGSGEVAHYGIVVEQTGVLEGAQWPSDTRHVVDGTMPGEAVRRAEVLVLRTDPELWLAPNPGAEVHAAFARLLEEDHERARAEVDTLPEVPRELFRAAVGAINELVSAYVRDGRTADLPELEDTILYLELVLFAGHEVAARAVRR